MLSILLGLRSQVRALEAEAVSLVDQKRTESEELEQRLVQGAADLASAREAEQIAQGRAASLEVCEIVEQFFDMHALYYYVYFFLKKGK